VQEPFPEEVEVPYGLVNIRLIWNIPAWVFVVLFILGVAPFYLWGWRKWWVSLLCLGLGSLIAVEAVDDARFLTCWFGEMRLKDYYE